jgi:hypothetical protein
VTFAGRAVDAVQTFERVPRAARGREAFGTRSADEPETDRQRVAVELEDSVRPVAGLGSGDELDIDVRRGCFDVDREDALVAGLGRCHAKPIAVDQHARLFERGRGHCGAVDLERVELPFALERAQLRDVTRESGPRGEAGLARDRRLRVREPKPGGADLRGGHVVRGR